MITDTLKTPISSFISNRASTTAAAFRQILTTVSSPDSTPTGHWHVEARAHHTRLTHIYYLPVHYTFVFYNGADGARISAILPRQGRLRLRFAA